MQYFRSTPVNHVVLCAAKLNSAKLHELWVMLTRVAKIKSCVLIGEQVLSIVSKL